MFSEPSIGQLSRHATVDYSNESALPRRLNGTSVDAPSYQNLHRELLLSHKRYRASKEQPDPEASVYMSGRSCRGLLLEEKPELTRVLEQRRLELHREEEMAQRRPSDLETELRKRQQKLEEVRVKKPAANRDISVKFTVTLRYRSQYSACLGYDADTVQIYRPLFRLQVGLDRNSASAGLYCRFLFFSTSKRRSGSGRTSRRSQSLCVWRTTWGEHRHLNNEASSL